MSEPDAGSDVASIRTRAVRDGDHFVVNGQKIWNSGAKSADWIYLIARTDPDARPHEGMSELIVDMHSPGITIKPNMDITGNRSEETREGTEVVSTWRSRMWPNPK